MLKCVYPTQAAKLGIIAATYRSGTESVFGSCPASCPLLPLHARTKGTTLLSLNYLAAEREAVPRGGLAWSYTHWAPRPDFLNTNPERSTLNISTDTPLNAIRYFYAGYDTTYVAPVGDTQWPRRISGVLFARCPAELRKNITCQSCGNGRPLCARQNRKFVIVFTAHGTKRGHVTTKTGGCYAANYPCSTQWESTRRGVGPTTWDETKDPDRLIVWARSLPRGTFLRHRIAGDLGCAPLSSPV